MLWTEVLFLLGKIIDCYLALGSNFLISQNPPTLKQNGSTIRRQINPIRRTQLPAVYVSPFLLFALKETFCKTIRGFCLLTIHLLFLKRKYFLFQVDHLLKVFFSFGTSCIWTKRFFVFFIALNQVLQDNGFSKKYSIPLEFKEVFEVSGFFHHVKNISFECFKKK